MSVKSWLVPLTAAFVLSTSPVYADSDNNTTAKDPNKKICKKYRPTGTRIAKKTCMTQRGWDELKRKAQEAARRATQLGGQQNMEGN